MHPESMENLNVSDYEHDGPPPYSGPRCFFVHPQLFASMAVSEENDEATKGRALEVLAQMQEMSAPNRSTDASQVAQIQGKPALASSDEGGLYREIYDLQFCKERAFPGILVRNEGEDPLNRNGDVAPDKCYENLGIVHDFFLKVFGRNSIDGKGMKLKGIVHFDFYFPGAWWEPRDDILSSKSLVFGDGFDNDPWHGGAYVRSFAGNFGNFTGSLEVVAHEMTHGIIQHTVQLQGVGEPGALDEHLADVFGCMVEQWHKKQTVDEADWIIGEDLLRPGHHGLGLRSMKAPGTAYDAEGIGKDPQVDHMSKFYKGNEDLGGVHINSGIPNKAFYLFARKLGGYSWEKAGNIWYTAMGRMTKHCSFRVWSRLTARVSEELFDKKVVADVKEAWVAVGVI